MLLLQMWNMVDSEFVFIRITYFVGGMETTVNGLYATKSLLQLASKGLFCQMTHLVGVAVAKWLI